MSRLQRFVWRWRRRRHFISPQKDHNRRTMGEEPRLRVDKCRTRNLREILLWHRTLELLHKRRGPRSCYSFNKAGNPQRTRPVQVSLKTEIGAHQSSIRLITQLKAGWLIESLKKSIRVNLKCNVGWRRVRSGYV